MAVTEALIRLPESTVLASNGAHASAVPVTVPGGDYHGVSTLLPIFQQRLNDNVQGYPTTAAAMRAAVGYGTWSAGWLCNEPSGNLAAAFGSPTLVPSGSGPSIYGIPGPRGGIDTAIGFDTNTELFGGGDVHDPVTGDLLFAMVLNLTTSANGDFFGKGWGTSGYVCVVESGALIIYLFDGTNYVGAACPIPPLNTWCVVMGVLERATNRARIAYRALDGSSNSTGSEADTSALGVIDSGLGFTVGHSNGYSAHLGAQIAALYIGTGSGAAGGLSANLTTASNNLANAINASWSASLSDGQVTLANTFWPASVSFPPALRDALGFERDFDYPQTAAQMAAAVGYGAWTAGWLFNETTGPTLAASFGGVNLTGSGISYGVAAPRGGLDKAINFTSTSNYATAGDNFDAGSGDFAFALVIKFGATGVHDVLGKGYPAGGPLVITDGASFEARLIAHDGSNAAVAQAPNATALNTWMVMMGALDRSTNKLRFGWRSIDGGSSSVSAEADVSAVGALNNAAGFAFGSVFAGAHPNMQIAAAYVAAGPGAATGLSANLPTALANFAAHMKSQTGTQQARGLKGSKYARMMTALLPPGRLWRAV